MDWPTILTIILGSSVFGAVLTLLLERFFKRQDVDKYNKFIALTLAQDLENYSWDCAEGLSNHDLYNDSEGHAGKRITFPSDSFKIPDENFRNFDIQILEKIYAFPLLIRSSRSQIQFWDDVTGQDEAYQSAYEETLKLGSEALSIAKDIRGKYGISNHPIVFGNTNLQELYTKKSKK